MKRWFSPKSIGGQLALIITLLTLIGGRWGEVTQQLALIPSSVIEDFKLWQLATHGFISVAEGWSIIFTIVICLQAGTFLEQRWGARRLWLFVVLVNVIAGVVTVLIGLFSPRVAHTIYLGGLTTTTILWVAEGVILGPQRVNFFFFPITGYVLAVIGAISPLVIAWTRGWWAVVPQLVGIAVTIAWVKEYTPAQLWLRFRSAQLERDLRKRASHLSVIDGKRRDRDQYLN
ncbi:MAG: DUF1751 domain-containing protein [Myxococcaceae bacterium]|nr:DUF1751 domain-containing protein [Myxococcaceae bacterium]